MRFARRMQRLGTETAFEVLARAKQLEAEGRSIIHLEIGEPDFDTPQHIIDAACEALNSGYTHYGPSIGDIELREAVAEYINKTRATDFQAENVVIVPGAKPIIYFGITALIDPGDEVIYPNPGYPIYESMINFVGGVPVPIPLLEKNEFRLDPEQLASLVTDKTKIIILNSPHNPTSGVLTYEDLEAVAKIAIENDIMVMSDEPYEQIIYDGEHHSIAAIDGMAERTIILDSMSKSFAMTGWRLGYGIGPKELVDAIAKLETNCNSCTTTFVQRAGIAALQGSMDETHKMAQTFKERRDVIIDGLNAIEGISCLRPHGAFYAFPNITETGYDCRELATKCLEEAGVAVLAGTAFGEYGEGYLRLSYANSVQNIQMSLDRIAGMLTGG